MEEAGKTTRRLFRSRVDRYLSGVCGGLGEYFQIDSNIVRIIFVVLAFMGGIGILLYLAGLIIIPENPSQEPQPRKASDTTFFWAVLLIVVGLILLFKELGLFYYFNLWHIPWSVVWGVFLIALGLILIFSFARRGVPETGAAAEETSQLPESAPRIYRSRTDRMIAGVCGGLAKYFNIDSSLVRLGWVLASLASVGLGLLVYILLVIIFPEEPTEQTV